MALLHYLLYSDCHGLQEPEMKQEVHYINTLKKQDHCYIGQRLKRYSQFLIPADAPPAACMKKGCKLREGQPGMASTVIAPGHTWRMETYYYRKNHTYINAPCCKPRLGRPVGAPPIKRLLFYGDSTVKNSWDIMTYTARRPCKVAWKPRLLHELFDPSICNQKASMEEIDTEMDVILKRCTGGAPWTSVPVGVNTWDVAQYYPLSMSFNMTHFEYNDTYARNHMPPLQLPLPREFSFVYVDGWGALDYMYIKERFYFARPGDVYIINMGPHYTRTRSFQI
ncbi:hypothetical protein CEUSTIGMA_g12834.t1 [Chlamydomonas eustigma]|uniref:Uncharacterized protein n=1 Tax=Chlamydomonas eustigma TaxID=1157962 RepID=A0A250XQT0_9CHLO|nr:hypothetical protein CEUSTIGMA_g12834.t1 [Chlamydomonas eustigma]|eukprot:GAX85418.1 hypothetical protein CEUSTIGMA_g12834.t1 [Chlamydomonas eustigma]